VTRLKPSSLVWVRLRSVPIIAALRPAVARAFVAHLVGHENKIKSLDDLESSVLADLNQRFAKLSNDQLEAQFLEFLKDSAQ
jgi:hypothetical protein